jgi:hypothetical protein
MYVALESDGLIGTFGLTEFVQHHRENDYVLDEEVYYSIERGRVVVGCNIPVLIPIGQKEPLNSLCKQKRRKKMTKSLLMANATENPKSLFRHEQENSLI